MKQQVGDMKDYWIAIADIPIGCPSKCRDWMVKPFNKTGKKGWYTAPRKVGHIEAFEYQNIIIIINEEVVPNAIPIDKSN